ncbi:LPXTG-motif cell wall-anchored protein [Arthrobacter silviterrae]|uniref:LPXTG cell wall anchor domain-containing protein n=1 Tax=Arthrobacter silviterrae TaxID=2026658 RepID=A0ABX0DC95_9MICC|nr:MULTISPECIES: LPXTG cell wall anchor domain-containing protein [Arthrobacter]MCU6479247.1 LPXTG cell wall anchor domain-containing protein [Arthrobacter sp. A2-55]MDQ0277650.1 LPXTG-motif cell wall-anchored protein [Arthrobacter silviterrae]NGN84248.1 LPXTG cell wall anchor domain-containing protein [Arthrobacter silviterrae]
MNTPTEPISFPGDDNVTRPDAGAEAQTQTESTRHPVRVGTLVWGAVVVVLGILVIASRQAGLRLDTGQTAMWLLFGAGLAMVAGGAVSVLRKK